MKWKDRLSKIQVGDKVICVVPGIYGITTVENGYGIVTEIEEYYIEVEWYIPHNDERRHGTFCVKPEYFKKVIE